MSSPEILAPAGSFEALTAAVRCGADAVYLGGQTLNARRNAANFDDAALYEAVSLCHTHGTKLYLTLNTLASDGEMQDVRRMLEYASRIGVDALILQDLGVVRLVRESCDIPMHASTQMSVQTSAGAAKLRELGFVRMVAPRELSRAELLTLREKTDLEIELFVHGALCMSVSGQCLMSAVFGGRSGNRGLCAQPCRLAFRAPGGTGHDLSLKDNSLLPHLRDMRDMGMDSFKIEGRMKRPEYVAAAVTACKKALDGAGEDEIFDALRSVFSRSGFTDGYYTGKRGVSMFGTRQKEDVTAASAVLPKLQALYREDKPLYPVHFSLRCAAESPVTLTAHSGNFTAEAQGEVPSAAKNKALDAASAEKQLQKCGGTLFYVDGVETQIEDGLFLPASSLNALRRQALDDLLLQIGKTDSHTYNHVAEDIPPHTSTPIETYVRFADVSQIPKDLQADKLFLPLYLGAETIAKHHAVAELPRALFGREDEVRETLLQCKAAGVQEASFASLDGLALIESCSMTPIAFFGSNIYNTSALMQLEALGVQEAVLSAELTLSEAEKLGGKLRRGLFAYGHLPLMLTRNCPQKNGKSCAACRRTGAVTDRKGVTFPIECRSGCAEILNDRPVYLADKVLRGVDFRLLYFTVESAETCAAVLRAYGENLPPTGAFTRGPALRGVE